MRTIRVLVFLLLTGIWAVAEGASGVVLSPQDAGSKPLSPPAKAQCKFPDGQTIIMDYSSPRMRGRKIFGELVPYGEVWRTGANQATTFVADGNIITVNGTRIPAGSYTIFTVPNSDNWTLIINKHTGEAGIPYKYQSEELARVPMKVTKLSSPVENFTIAFDRTGASCMMNMRWENTQASVEFTEMNTDMPTLTQ